MATLEQMYTPQAFSPQTTLSQDIGASDTRIYVANVNVFPTPPTLATIGTDAASAETVKITAKGTNFIDVQRGLLGTAKSWTTNSVIARNFSAADQVAIQNNINTLNATKLESVEADDVVNNTLTNDKLAKVATNTLKGRKSVNQGNVEDLSVSDVRAMLDIQKGADVTNTVLEAAGDTTIADNDKLVLVDVSVSSGSKIRTVLWSAIKTALNNLFVPKTRTVNQKALSENISLTAADVGAASAINSATSLPTSGSALTANTLYNVASAVTAYNFVSPSSNGWAHGIFIVGTSPNITFSGTIIGKLPTFEANKKYEFDVFANTWIVQEIVSQS